MALGRMALMRMALCALLPGLGACVFEPPAAGDSPPPPPPFNLGYPFRDVPISPVSDSGERMVFEDPGNMVVHHGFACAESHESDVQRILRVQHSLPVPATMDRATVFLSGWRLTFLNGDHHIRALGTGIINIRLEGNQLLWEAVGGIGDDGYDDPYRWCYYYTRLAWNRAVFSAGRDDRDQLSFASSNASGWDTALTFHRRTVDTVWAGQYLPTKAAILPRGFNLYWSGNDHHLLQLAYNLDYSEGYDNNVIDVATGSTVDQVAGRVHSWETKIDPQGQ